MCNKNEQQHKDNKDGQNYKQQYVFGDFPNDLEEIITDVIDGKVKCSSSKAEV